MMGLQNTKQEIERWNQIRSQQKARKSHRSLKIGIIGFAGLLIVLIILYYYTDILVKPSENITVSPQPNEWSMFGRDLTHSGAAGSSADLPQGVAKTILSTGAPIHSSPVYAGGLIYVGSRSGAFYAIEESTGRVNWQFQAGSWIDSSPAIVNHIVYFGSNDGYLYALDAASGRKLWGFYVKYPIRSSPAVADGKVYFGCDDYAVYALDAATGKKIWRKSTGNIVTSSPAVAKGIVYIASYDGGFYALDAQNGRQRLYYSTSRSAISSPVVRDQVVYCCTEDGLLLALDGRARNWFGESKFRIPWQILHLYGDLSEAPPPSGYLWSLEFKTPIYSSPVVAGNSLYLGMGKNVISINLENHQKQWESATGDIVSAVSWSAPGLIYAAGSEGHLYVLDAATGERLRDVLAGGSITSSPLIVNGTVYISSEDGNLYSVN